MRTLLSYGLLLEAGCVEMMQPLGIGNTVQHIKPSTLSGMPKVARLLGVFFDEEKETEMLPVYCSVVQCFVVA